MFTRSILQSFFRPLRYPVSKSNGGQSIVVRKLFTSLLACSILTLLATPLSAYNAQGYVKVYNYTESELQVWLDDVQVGTIPVSSAPNWLPTDYGLHKVQVYKPGDWHNAQKYCEVSYSYPNASVEINRYDL